MSSNVYEFIYKNAEPRLPYPTPTQNKTIYIKLIITINRVSLNSGHNVDFNKVQRVSLLG